VRECEVAESCLILAVLASERAPTSYLEVFSQGSLAALTSLRISAGQFVVTAS
jgi:hypothetical protein